MNQKIVSLACVVLLSLCLIACSEKTQTTAPGAVPLQVFKQEITSLALLQTLKVDETTTMHSMLKFF